jgi:hypothetical protein
MPGVSQAGKARQAKTNTMFVFCVKRSQTVAMAGRMAVHDRLKPVLLQSVAEEIDDLVDRDAGLRERVAIA